MTKGSLLIWAVFLIGQQINVLIRAYFAVHGPDPSLQKYGDYYKLYWPVVIIRSAFGMFFFGLLAYHPDTFWKLVEVTGVTLSDNWRGLLTLPVNLTTAFGLGMLIDFGLDVLSTMVPKLKEIIPSSQFYKRISEISAQDPAPKSTPTSAGGQKGFMKIGTLLLIVLLTGSVLLFTACPNQSQVHKAAQTADGIAMSLNNIEKLQESANAQGLISNDDSRAISIYVGQSVHVNEQLIAQIRAVKALNTQSADSILAALDSVAASVNTLEQQGVLHIKDLNTQHQFAGYMSTVRAAIQSIRQILAASGASPSARARPNPELRLFEVAA